MGSQTASLLADIILASHILIVACNIIPVPLIIIGGIRGWGFVRARWFRYGHLALMGFVAVQSWLGKTCPLTVWERSLRAAAGEDGYAESGFISHWMQAVLYIDAPAWFFVALYSSWCALIVALFYWVPVKRRSPKTSEPLNPSKD